MYRLSFLFTRTAILLYVSLVGNFSLYNGYLIDKSKLHITVCTAISQAVVESQEDYALTNAIEERAKKK
jgi:hypothetical protein